MFLFQSGDKEGTAINIAIACNLLAPSSHMRHIVINGQSGGGVERIRELCEREIREMEVSAI